MCLFDWVVGPSAVSTAAALHNRASTLCAEISAWGWVCPDAMWATPYSAVKKAAWGIN